MDLATPEQLKPKPPVSSLVFGKHFTDHMLTIDWSATKGWENPRITPLQPLAIHPAAKVLHYALEVGTLLVLSLRCSTLVYFYTIFIVTVRIWTWRQSVREYFGRIHFQMRNDLDCTCVGCFKGRCCEILWNIESHDMRSLKSLCGREVVAFLLADMSCGTGACFRRRPPCRI